MANSQQHQQYVNGSMNNGFSAPSSHYQNPQMPQQFAPPPPHMATKGQLPPQMPQPGMQQFAKPPAAQFASGGAQHQPTPPPSQGSSGGGFFRPPSFNPTPSMPGDMPFPASAMSTNANSQPRQDYQAPPASSNGPFSPPPPTFGVSAYHSSVPPVSAPSQAPFDNRSTMLNNSVRPKERIPKRA